MGLLDLLNEWLQNHPHLAGLLVMAIAFGESLALVGLFLPGAALMFGIGAFVGAGVLPFWPTLAWAAAGAIAGDGVSFWIGHHFRHHLHAVWPFRTYSELFARSVALFQRHGVKAVILGRFIGPMRPLIPAVAGMFQMPPRRFFVVDVLSGLLWAPAYIIPGMVFSSSLGLAAEVTTRLALFGGVVLILLVMTPWLTRQIFFWFHQRAYRFIATILDWSRVHPRLGSLPTALLDPNHPETRALSLLALMLLGVTVLLGWLLEAMTNGGLLARLDIFLRESIPLWRTPGLDHLFAFCHRFGDVDLLLLTTLFVALWLLWQRQLVALAHWLAAGLFGFLSAPLLHAITPFQDAFPSPFATTASTLYVFFAILAGRDIRSYYRWVIHALAILLLSAALLAHLYFDGDALSAILGGLLLGLGWSTILGIAYRRHSILAPRLRGLLPITSGVIALALLLNLNPVSNERLPIAAPPLQPLEDWRGMGWRGVDAWRHDLRGHDEQPLNLQYVGDLKWLESVLSARGWYSPIRVSGTSWLEWLNGNADVTTLPVLPQVHNGRYEETRWVRRYGADEPLLTLRLWPGHRVVEGKPLWVGTLSWLALPQPTPMLRALRTVKEWQEPLERFMQEEWEGIHISVKHRHGNRLLLLGGNVEVIYR